ncbi:MAG: hypothetical protein AAF708_15985 [Deinococcota bacterium]
MKLFLLIAAAFAGLVLLSGYYIIGGPVPHTITWESDVNTSFNGHYTVTRSDAGINEILEAGNAVQGNLPLTKRFWASRYATVAADLSLDQEDNAYTTITIKRAGVPCAIGYKYGTELSTACD